MPGAPLTDITFRLATQFNIHQLSKQAVYLWIFPENLVGSFITESLFNYMLDHKL